MTKAKIAILPTIAALSALGPVYALSQANWSTTYERSGYVATGRYAEAVTYCERLAAASHGKARVIRYGTSPQGRPMVALAMSGDNAFTAAAASASSRPLVIINNGIHSGEIEGKDADLLLARDILISGKHAELLKKVNILMIPVFSVDAHERFTPYNRINQNGPVEMGWRATAENLNLNRDFMKADSAEMRALLGLIHSWKPDFLFDNHTTDGADWQYTIQIDVPTAPTLNPAGIEWSRQLIAEAMPLVEKDGFLTSPYFDGVDYNNLKAGVTISDFGPRYSTGYMAAINRPSMLVETHMLKPYKQRVDATYSINLRVIQHIAATAEALKAANRSADVAEASLTPGTPVTLTSLTSPASRPFVFRGLEYKPFRSEVSGGMIPAWTSTPVDTQTTIRDQYLPDLVVNAPAAYLIPAQWADVISRLKIHGIQLKRLARPVTGRYTVWRFKDVRFPPMPFESRFQPSFHTIRSEETLDLPGGSAVAVTSQPGAKLLMQLLEPDAPDSLVRWGLMNTIFEQKEYFESYQMEKVAVKMLREDAKLKAEFEEKLKDPKFASSPRARLEYLYEKSKYADAALNRYPVVPLTAAQLAALSLVHNGNF